MPAVLEGIRVLDFSRIGAGPLSAQMLGDLGADVIKVEDVEGGMLDRRVTYPWLNDEALLVLQMNRNKRSIAVDISSPEGKDIIYKLARQSDVVVTNFRPSVKKRLKVAYEDLRRLNEKIIYVSVSGFGDTGPYAEKKGQDLLAQAMSGAMWMNSFADNPPIPIGTLIADLDTAKLSAYGVLAALIARDRFGVGQEVQVSLLDTMVDLQMHDAFYQLNGGGMYRRGRHGRGNSFGSGVPYGAYETSDGKWIAISAGLAEVCYALGIEDLSQDPRYDTWEKQREHQVELWRFVERAMAEHTAEQALGLFEAADIWAAPVYDYEEAFLDPQVLHNEMLIELENPRGGTFKTTGMPVKLSHTPAGPRRRPPRYAEHTAEVLESLGYSPSAIKRLAEKRADKSVVVLGEAPADS